MREDNTEIRLYPELDPEEKSRVLDAVQLLINLFWSWETSQDWLNRLQESRRVWSSLQGIIHPGPEQVLYLIDEIQPSSPGEQLNQELESEFVRIFISTREGISAPMYHSCFQGSDQVLMQRPAQAMRERLEQAGVEIAEHLGEPPDHLCIELEYLYLLLELELREPSPDIHQELADFAGNFMLPWIKKFRAQIPETNKAAFFAHTAQAMQDLLEFLGRENTSLNSAEQNKA